MGRSGEWDKMWHFVAREKAAPANKARAALLNLVELLPSV